MLGKAYRMPIYSIYGFVRIADEIVDTFHDYDKHTLINEFEHETWLALERGVSTNPILHSFADVVNRYHIDKELIVAFLESMKMDLYNKKYDESLYSQYIYGSAEVVGLMCLKVFCDGSHEMYERLKANARSLGAAFQKVNFLRDLKDDYADRGRVYFPDVDFSAFDDHAKKMIEEDIQKDFDHALIGIRQLPEGSRIGVYLAYKYYLKLFKKIKNIQPSRIMEERIRISNLRKISLLAKSFAMQKMNMF
jgi:phytoene/squalene synthetase